MQNERITQKHQTNFPFHFVRRKIIMKMIIHVFKYLQDKPVLQYEPPRNNRPQAVTKNVFVPVGLIQDQESSQQYEQTPTVRPQTTTASIFAPRTEDMNKGFLTFSEDQPGLTSESSV